MSDRPPQVDFSTPYSEFQALSLERSRLQGVASDIRAAMKDVKRFGAEGARYAEMAAMWAATLMVAEICKLGLSAGDRRAKVLFNAQDRMFAQANKMLKFLGMATIATKDDVLKTLDPDLRSIDQMTGYVQTTREFLKKVGVNENKETRLVLDLVVAMTQDTLLIMQAMKLQQQVSGNATAAQVKMQQSLTKVTRKIMLIDSELTRMIERAQARMRTA
jgi:hypothetical protein